MSERKRGRWSYIANDDIPSPRVDAFLIAVAELCEKHGFCIGHEDTGGAFVISRYASLSDTDWLMAAHIDATIPPVDA